MLQRGTIEDGDKLLSLDTDVRGSDRLPMVFQMWTAELARDVLRLGVYFSALGVMLQVPGAAEYEWVCDDDYEDPTLLPASSHSARHCTGWQSAAGWKSQNGKRGSGVNSPPSRVSQAACWRGPTRRNAAGA